MKVLYRDINNSIAAATKQFPFGSDSIINHIACKQADLKEPSLSSSQSSSTEAHVAQAPSRLKPVSKHKLWEGGSHPTLLHQGGRGMARKSVAEARVKQCKDAKIAKGSTAVSANTTAAVAEAHFIALTSLSTSPISSIIDA